MNEWYLVHVERTVRNGNRRDRGYLRKQLELHCMSVSTPLN